MSVGVLSDTSALVTIMAGRNIHTSPQSMTYLDMLDLSPGNELIRRCHDVWPHLDQLVKNRKWCIMNETMRCLATGIRQVVILGSGMDPLSLEIISRMPDVMVFELDTDNMDSKRRLLDAVPSDTVNRIRCITADLGRPAKAVKRAVAAGWTAKAPSVLVMEGISYYLTEQALLDLISGFGTHSENQGILEYMVPNYMIDPERAHIPDMVFGTLSDYLSNSLLISRLDPDQIRNLVSNAGGHITQRHTMRCIESERTGGNQYFPTDSSGWIEVVAMKTNPTG